MTSRTVLTLKSHEGGSNSYITKYSTVGLYSFCCISALSPPSCCWTCPVNLCGGGGSDICVGVPGVGITVVVVVVGGVLFLYFLWK